MKESAVREGGSHSKRKRNKAWKSNYNRNLLVEGGRDSETDSTEGEFVLWTSPGECRTRRESKEGRKSNRRLMTEPMTGSAIFAWN